MQAMMLDSLREPLRPVDRMDPVPGSGEMRIKVEACAICRTDLHVIDGDLPHPRLPIIPGHEIVGLVDEVGPGVDRARLGCRVGVGWLGHTCGQCPYCLRRSENLCDRPEFTGYTRDGGFATHAVVDAGFAFDLDAGADAAAQAPLLCAGLIGWRSLKKTGDAKPIGFYGFGAAAHILVQICVWQGREVFAFTRPGDQSGQRFAKELGAAWVGDSDESPPMPLDAAIIFAPVGELVPAALRAVRKGGTVVCGGIHMSDIPAMPYEILWEERELVSVANLTRRDAEEFFPLAQAADVKTVTTRYPLAEANAAVADLRAGRLNGAAVLVP
ncbi:zinc-dependent alcohol dehydrogenase family protein [Pseudaminobacter sp. 19-2017]|uniref:Zinc-dependent alcohol dehydrogenase family protein n=1 Tax=Pseudaminobacter soli (ex Zhang et al. 2022) TaxID=2831468 RepID=A0A942DZC9_9HYPH|nr:zinc-dependent alcohol dehydrogenase family protein [Pseudaminobacter soli]MBS3649942.1 zinc-dependent alcohol dehydrogenase family protein [Pseudaminobacter soli]